MRHMKLLHKDSLEFTCKDCNRNFISKFSLKKHLESKHGSEITASKSKIKPKLRNQFFQDEAFSSEKSRLAQIKNKCADEDIDYYVREAADILGIMHAIPGVTAGNLVQASGSPPSG